MVKFRNAISCVLVAAVAAGLCTGCSNSKYTCNSKNVMGFEGYYYEDGELYVVFDEDRLDDNMKHSVYENEEWDGCDQISVYLNDDDSYEVDSDDVDVDVSHGQLLISFEMDRADAGKITGFCFDISDGSYILDLEEGTLDIEVKSDLLTEYYSQTYNQSKDKWSKADYDYEYDDDYVGEKKPVIYLYPVEETDVSVSLDLDGNMTCSYPEYGDGWNVTASPDGKIYDPNTDRYYDYLFWEGTRSFDSYVFSSYACVPAEDTAEFLESYLEAAGLNDSEIDDFISYWLPTLQESPYNLISFPSEEYNEWAKLNVYPEPDTVIRVYMVFTPVDEPIEVPESNALIMPSGIERQGFTVVEWGGSVLYDKQD